MANSTLNVKLLQAYDTETNWSTNNPVLLAGQMAISSDKDGMYKVGDGTSTWSALSYNAANTAASATKLATARTIRTNLASTSTASFNGTANITPGVTGTLPIGNGGTGTTTGHIAITAGTDTTSTASPAHGGTFTAIDGITKDDYGHVTAVNTKTITLPSDNNTDTKVTNTLATTTKAYVTGTTSSSTNTGTQVFDTGVYLGTTAGTLYASTFSGSLSGNATTATTATNVTYTGSTSGTWYNITGKASVSAGDTASIVMGDQTNSLTTNRIYQSNGTTSAVGSAYFEAGNSTASGTAGNAYGAYRLYGTDSYYWNIYGNKAAGANRTLYLPKTDGSLVAATNNAQVGSGVIPTYISSAGLVTASSSTVGSSTGPVYMSSGTITACGSSLAVSVTGNAATATTLATARTIEGASFDGSAAITNYATCDTAAATAAKVATCSSTFSLVTGARVMIKFTYANSASSATLNVNSTGAKSIERYGTTALTTYQWNAGGVAEFVYDGTNWVMVNGTTATTTYYGMVKLSSSTSSTSTSLAATPSAVKAAYDLANTANTAVADDVTESDIAAIFE